MSSFQGCQEIEVRGMADIIGFIKQRAYEGRFVLTDKGNV